MGRVIPRTLHLQALCRLATYRLPPDINWKQVVSTLKWTSGKTTKPPSGKYLNETYPMLASGQSLSNWSRSSCCLASPTTWPPAILPFFKHRLVPTPYEIGNVKYSREFLSSHNPTQLTLGEHGFLDLLLYSMGFRLEEINDYPGASLRSMAAGAAWLAEDPRFIIWATGTDFSRSTLPFKVGKTLEEQMSLLDRLKKNPFLLSKEEARPLVESPSALTYLIYSTHKLPRLTLTNSSRITVGVFDVD